MKIPKLTLVSLLSFIATVSIATGSSGNTDPELEQIAGYRQWKRVTEPTKVVSASTPGG